MGEDLLERISNCATFLKRKALALCHLPMYEMKSSSKNSLDFTQPLCLTTNVVGFIGSIKKCFRSSKRRRKITFIGFMEDLIEFYEGFA